MESLSSAGGSAAFLKLILENLPDIVFVKDEDLRHVFGNQAFLDLFPPDVRDTIIGSTGTSNIAPEDVEAYQAKDKEAFEQGSSFATERIAVVGGDTRTFETKKIRFEGEDGKSYLLGLARDVTQIAEATDELENAQNFQDLVLQHMPDLVFVKDDQFRIVQANDTFLEVYPPELRDTVIGTTTLEHYDDEEREQFLKHDRIALEQGYSETEEAIDFPDGRRRVLLTKKARFEDHEGKRFILGLGRDITELVEARRNHEVSLELLGNVFDTVTGAIVGLDANKRVLLINNAGRHMLAGEISEPPFAWPDEILFLDPDNMQPLESSHDPIARALIGLEIGGEVHLMTRRSSDDLRYVRVTSALVRSKTSPLSTVVVLEDVSEAERNRQQLERQSRLDALGQLTGGIAHDFNNLLNTMQYALELLGREPLSERGRRSANAALSSIERGGELTNRLLAFAKRQPSRSSAQPLSEVFAELEPLVESAIEASVVVKFADPPPELLVFCDQGQLQNALLNLILNSRDAIVQSGTGDTIRLEMRSVDKLPVASTDADDRAAVHSAEGRLIQQAQDTSRNDGRAQRYIEISVSDNGPGMSKAVASRALDPFFTTKGEHSGTGLGLSMVYGFVKQSDGELRIYTEEGRGTSVKLFLPRGDVSTGLEAPMPLAAPVEGQNETILIVEDEPYLLEQLDELLKELKYRTVTAASGRDAIGKLRDGLDVDLILTDVVMPGGVGGFELARLAREELPGVPIIYMSGYTGFTNEEMGEVIAPLLPKPSSPAMTSSQIRAVLDQKGSQKGK